MKPIVPLCIYLVIVSVVSYNYYDTHPPKEK